jgi:mannose-6-phosphate isomerase-like protein (cupin superfamily)
VPPNSFEITVHLRSEDTDGHAGVMVNVVPGGWEGPPLHHHDFAEAFYVLDGELTFQLGNDLVTAGPGELIFAPGGAHHTFANLGNAPATYMLICTPAGFERYFDRLAAGFSGTPPPPEAAGPIPETVVVGPSIARNAQDH